MWEGWIKLYRSIQDDDLYFAEKFTKMQAWCDLLLLAEYKPKIIYVRGIKVTIERGQLAIPIRELASRWQWGVNRVQSFLRELEEADKILLLKGHTINVIGICNYEKYQTDTQNSSEVDTQIDTQTDTQNTGKTNTQKASVNKGVLRKIAGKIDTQITDDLNTQNSSEVDTQIDTQTDTQGKEKVTKKKYIQEDKKNILGEGAGAFAPAPQPKKPKTKEEILKETEARRQKFYNSLIPFVQTYGKAMVRAFYDYWSELNKSCTKMKWELCQTWELDKRLATWEKKDSQFNNRNNGTGNPNNGQRTGDATIERQMQAVVNDIAKADEYYYQPRREQSSDGTPGEYGSFQTDS